MLPTQNKYLKEKGLLGVTHLCITTGIALASYGGAPSATGAGGVINQTCNKVGSLILLAVLFAVCVWMWPTMRKIQRYSVARHPNAQSARMLWWGTVGAMPFWLVRLAYLVTYAFEHKLVLDPVMGTFAVKLVLVFGTYLFASIPLLVGGWFGVRKANPGSVDDYMRMMDGSGDLQACNTNVEAVELVDRQKR